MPKDDLEDGKTIECKSCGCKGCASGDWMIKKQKIECINISWNIINKTNNFK